MVHGIPIVVCVQCLLVTEMH